MFEKYLEQTERFLRPMNEIWALQTQAAESFTKTNSNLLSEVWQGGLSLAQSMPAQKSMDDAIKLQQSYWQGVTQTLQKAAEDNHSVLTSVNQKIADVMQNTSAVDVADDMMPGGSRAAKAAASEAEKAASAAKKASASAAADITTAGRNVAADPLKAEVASAGKSSQKSTQKSPAKPTAKKSASKGGDSSSVGKAVSSAHGENPKAAASPKTAAGTSVPPSGASSSSGKSDGSKGGSQQNKPEQGRPSSH